MHNVVLYSYIIYLHDYMYYATSVRLMTENMRFWPYSYLCFFGGTLIFDGWSA